MTPSLQVLDECGQIALDPLTTVTGGDGTWQAQHGEDLKRTWRNAGWASQPDTFDAPGRIC